jgi:hypothetical protein
MKVNISNKQIIIIILLACFCVLGYIIYMIPISESMKEKKQRTQHSETKDIEDSEMPEIHVSLDDINKQLGEPELNNEKVKIVDKYGKISYTVISTTFGNPTYYKPGTYRYGAANYVPTYEDSVFLSKSLNGYSKFESDNDENKHNKHKKDKTHHIH